MLNFGGLFFRGVGGAKSSQETSDDTVKQIDFVCYRVTDNASCDVRAIESCFLG